MIDSAMLAAACREAAVRIDENPVVWAQGYYWRDGRGCVVGIVARELGLADSFSNRNVVSDTLGDLGDLFGGTLAETWNDDKRRTPASVARELRSVAERLVQAGPVAG